MQFRKSSISLQRETMKNCNFYIGLSFLGTAYAEDFVVLWIDFLSIRFLFYFYLRSLRFFTYFLRYNLYYLDLLLTSFEK